MFSTFTVVLFLTAYAAQDKRQKLLEEHSKLSVLSAVTENSRILKNM